MTARSPELAHRFFTNLGRVRNLIVCHAALQPLASPGADDVLRAAVVLLHATLEDLLREAEGMAMRADPANPKWALRWPGGKEREGLAALAPFVGQSTAEVFEAAIAEHLEQRTYNDFTQIVGALRALGIPTDGWAAALQVDLNLMTRRRHAIAHRADQVVDRSTGAAWVPAISPDHIALWLTAVEAVGQRVIDPHSTTRNPS